MCILVYNELPHLSIRENADTQCETGVKIDLCLLVLQCLKQLHHTSIFVSPNDTILLCIHIGLNKRLVVLSKPIRTIQFLNQQASIS